MMAQPDISREGKKPIAVYLFRVYESDPASASSPCLACIDTSCMLGLVLRKLQERSS